MKLLPMLAAALLGVATLSAQSVNDVITKYNDAAAQIGNKDFDGALTNLKAAVDMGTSIEGAEETVTNAQKLIPTCYFQSALSLIRQQKLDESLAQLSKAVETGELYGDTKTVRNANTVIAKVYTMKGANAFNNKDYATAASIFANGYAANPNDTKLALNLAMSYCEMGDLQKGGEVYSQILSLSHSKYAEDVAKAQTDYTNYLLAAAAQDATTGKYDEALGYTQKIIEMDSVSAAAHKLRIQLYNSKKDYAKVAQYAADAAEVQATPEEKSELYYMQGAALSNMEKYPEAIEAYKKVTAGSNVANAASQIKALTTIIAQNQKK